MSKSATYGMAVDTRRCVGCSACVLACKTENNVPDGYARRWVTQITEGRFPDLTMKVWSDCCQHCTDAPCVQSCPTGASHHEDVFDTVQVDRDLCTGCKACIASCPYGARFVHPEGFVDKCTLCAHRLGAGETTACAGVCPTSAIVVGDLDDPNSDISQLLRARHHSVQKPEAGTQPRFFLVE
ncbi:MAG: 4Fe-4S dicluster domain-containing protein [Planctomycetes bacterium]|jgi:Fe-S-cluster-containing dehydrogenase component|nr:4Fe-4S dicluster domain-containing protein [Planctomycetota bacterium]MBT4027945.1 4Fe-4S dicluster domain-containing protein [Planctomycetota bacterium]MBT4560060.1 4Fe-4S dicluster domain-containing protein [Planctomycetota bacterium]MBT5100861.1 4Fe-4S dicluster domain-containing protein [Planctomycetota bacterium]MBT5121023.1 4Fe-4S dicluster domain-containing protein [Planctomycetota bacterium]